MKKRFFAFVALATLIVAPTFAGMLDNTTHKDWSAGLSLGTNSGVQVDYKLNKDLTLETVVGFGVINTNLNVDLFGMYKVSDFEVNDLKFDVNAGIGVSVGTNFSSTFYVSPLAGAEIVYSFDDDFPMDIGIRAGVGPQFKIASSSTTMGIAWNAGLFGLWRFM